MKEKVIAILGLGLIGGSIGLALTRKCDQRRIILGWDQSQEAMDCAVARGAIDRTITAWEDLATVDVIFLCTPMQSILPLVNEIRPHIKPGAILTDVGSVKKCLYEALSSPTEDFYYIGGHPMAGREKSGIEAAQADLFVNKRYILIPSAHVPIEAVALLKGLITDLAADISFMAPDSHDRYAAVISHLPHVAAAGLVNTLGCYEESEEILNLAGGGFRDTTRIASSNAIMWTDICLTNKAEIITSIKKYQLVLDQLIDSIEQEEETSIKEFFAAAKQRRDRLLDWCDTKKSI